MPWIQTDCPIVALDLDGTLGPYHGHFTRFASEYVGRELPHSYDGSVPFNKWLGLSKPMYRKVKLAYRRGGLKRSMPAYEGAAEMTRIIRERKARIVICTTRPFLSLDEVEADTVHMLKRQGLQYDYIISGENKYRDLCKLVDKSRVVMVLEDQDDMLAQALSLGLPAVRAQGVHNFYSTVQVEAEVSSLEAATKLALTRIQVYSGDRYRKRERDRKRVTK